MEPPSFPTNGPRTVRTAPGDDTVLVLPLPSGSPPFQFDWSRVGAKLGDRFTSSNDAGGVRLTVSAARTSDSGVYTLQASNAAGKDTTRVRLEVSPEEMATGEDPPNFLRRLQDLTVKVGTRTRFLVEIVSSTECRVTWYRNERRLLEAERIALVRDGNFWCADISAVSVDDAGRWTCTAENVGGRASCSAHLNVLVPKAYKRPEFVEELRALLTEQGTVSLECKVVGVPTPVLRWFKDSREIKAGDVFALTANAEDPTSLGTYTCEAVNCMGRAYSSSKVHVVGRASREGSTRPTLDGVAPEPPPIFTKEVEDHFVRICEPLTMSCNLVVPPWPRSVVWYNKEGKIEASERYHILEDGVGGYLLELPSAEWPDEGEWKCVATSAGGRVGISTCYVSMDVPKNYRKPRFMENLQAVLTEEGLVSFECKVVGFPTPMLSWFKDGQELKPGDVYQLTGTNSLGSYCCIARNCMGQASSSAELTVEDIQNQLNEEEKLQLFSKNQAPKFLQGLKSVEAKIDEPFRFTIKVAIPPEPNVLWYRDDQPVDESSRCRHGKEGRGVSFLDIQNLEFMDQAEWKCVAMNDYGHSITSCFLKLIIPRHYKKPRFLENLQAILSDEGAVNLECKVIGVPQPVLKWYKDGEELKPGDIHKIISGQDGTCCLGTYTCEAQNCMGIAASSASLLGFEDSMKLKNKKKADEQQLQRNLSLSTIHEERTSQMYDTPVGDITLDERGEISFSFDGKEVSVSLYETPDLTEEEALQIVEMYADQLSENVTEHNVVELPPLRFVKETSTSGNLLMEAIIIDVSPEYFTSPEEDLRTEADIEDISIADENGPPQLSLDLDDDGEDYLEKTIALMSEEKSDIPKKLNRKKSDSQKSGDDYFSLSRDQSISDEKKDDDTQPLSESELQSFASARSSGKPKSKSSKPSVDDGQESSEITKTVLLIEDLQKQIIEENNTVPKNNQQRRRSRSSRRSSSGSEKSLNKLKQNVIEVKLETEDIKKEVFINEEKIKSKLTRINSSLTKVINDIQIVERDTILKSELMSTTATASRSLEIINNLLTPISDINSITEAISEMINEPSQIIISMLNRLPEPLENLLKCLTIVGKCIDVESENRTLVKKTSVSIIESCGSDLDFLIKEIQGIHKEFYSAENVEASTLENIITELITNINDLVNIVDKDKNQNGEMGIDVSEAAKEFNHLQNTQKAIHGLKSSLKSLLDIVNQVDFLEPWRFNRVKKIDIILSDMSIPIHDLQTALEHIEGLSIQETKSNLHKYNTEIIDTIMDSILRLRTSFKELSGEDAGKEITDDLNQILIAIKLNIDELFLNINDHEIKIGKFDILNNDNKIEVLQKMAQILITLENNLPILETLPSIKSHMSEFHKNLTKLLENVIESDDREKYFCLLEICEAINRINSSIKCIDSNSELSLANIRTTLKIVKEHINKNMFQQDLNQATSSNITNVLISIDSMYNIPDKMTTDTLHLETVQDLIIKKDTENKVKIILEHIEQTIAAWSTVTPHETAKELIIVETLNKICPILEDLKYNIANSIQEAEKYEKASDLDSLSYTESIAVQLCELHQTVNVLNHIFYENTDDHERSQLIGEYGKPLLELSTALQILQQDIISQCKENESYLNISCAIANVLESLQSCVFVQEQQIIEAADDMSTLEDISGIKSTAEIISSSDVFATATVEETTSKEFIEQFSQFLSSTSLQTLQKLNNHIMSLQNPEFLQVLDLVSNFNDYSIAKSVFTGLKPIDLHIENVYETSEDIPPVITSSLVSEIVQPLEKLEHKLSVIDISNIKSLENISENTKEKLSHLADNVLILKNDLSECLGMIKPTIEFADFMIVVSNKILNLRAKSEKLIYFVDYTMTKSSNTSNDNLMKLKYSLSNFLKSTNYPFEIKIPQIKEDIKNLYNALIIGHDELIKFTAPKLECLAEESTIIDTINDIEDNILTLEEYNFVDVSQNLDSLYATKPEVKTNSIMKVNDDIENTLKDIQTLSQDLLNYQIKFVEDFCETFRNEMSILRALIKKPSNSKRLIKLLQIFFTASNQFKDFQLRRLESSLPENITNCLSIFIVDTEECLKHLQLLLLEEIEKKSHILFDTPVSNINNIEASLPIILQSPDYSHLHVLVNRFLKIVRAIHPCFENIKSSVIKELYLGKIIDSESNSIEIEAYKEYEIFTSFILEELNCIRDDHQKDMYEQILNVIRKHDDYKGAIGSGKILIFIKCISDCSEIFQEILEMIPKPEELRENSGGEGTLEMNIADINNYLENVYTQLQEIQKQHLSCTEKTIVPLEIKSIKQINEFGRYLDKTMDCDTLSLNNTDVSLLIELGNKLQLIRNTLSCLESTSSFENLKALFKPIEEIERKLNKLLSSGNLLDEKNRILKEKRKSLLQHIEQYIEIIEIVEEVSAVIKLDNLKESANIVRELRQSIEVSENVDINEPSIENRIEDQDHLTQKLQKALISLQSQTFDNLQEFAPTINEDMRQQIIEVVTDLQNDLVALTGTNIFVEENLPILLLKREQENILDEDVINSNIVFEEENKPSDKVMDSTESEKHLYDSQNEIENKITIVKDKEPSHLNESQSNLNEIELNKLDSVTVLDASVTKEETGGADMFEEAQNINDNVSLNINSKDEESFTLISDISHEKSVAITDVLMNQLEKYISDDVLSTIQKLSPPLRTEHLKYTIKVAKQLLDCTDSTILDDTSLQTGLSGFSIDQFELALSMYESLSIMFETIFEQSIDLADLIGKDEFDSVKTVVSNLCATLQIIITSVKMSLDVEVSTNIQKQDSDVREQEELKPQSSGVTYNEIILTEIQNLPTSKSITSESIITADPVDNEYTDNLIGIKTLKAQDFAMEKLSEINTEQTLTLDNINITETPGVSCIDENKINMEKVNKDILIDNLDEYISEETLKVFENISPPLNLANINESIQTARQLHEAALLEEVGDLHLSKTQLQLALKLEKIISPICEILCVENTVLNEVSEYEQIKKYQATISNLQDTLKAFITLTQSQVDEQFLDQSEVNDLVTQKPVDYQLIINEEKSDLLPPAQTSTENVHQGDGPSDLLEIENTENLNKYVAKSDEVSQESKSNLDESNNTNILQEDVTTSIIEDLKDTTTVLQPNDEHNWTSLAKLLELFQDASNTIDLSSEILCVDSSEHLQNTLDEVQTVIMELKYECVGSIKDIFNETLEDLECNVRSVLLQINEHSPSIQLKEACVNLQTLAAYLCEMGDTVNIEISKSSNTLCDCTNYAENTIELLETASCIEGGKTMESIISNLNNIKDTMKFLRSSLSDEETLILRGIEVIQSLDSIEDRIFCLEKDIEAEKDIDPITRDGVISAVHSVYGSISNMREAVSNIQKKYMYANYGCPSRNFLLSIKNSMTISNYDNNKYWKDCAKAIRKVLNHFEDIKFYINFDKTARLPSDAAFTKIILTELYTMVSGVNQLHISHLDKDVSKRVQNCLDCVNEHLTALENKTTLEVKDKIPIFKNVSENILDFTHFLKNVIEKEVTRASGGLDDISEMDSHNLVEKPNKDDLNRSVLKDTEIVNDIELNKEIQNEITIVEEQLDLVTDAEKDLSQEENKLKNLSIEKTVLESNEILQETPVLKEEQEITLDIKVDENDRQIEKEISLEKLDKISNLQVTESVDSGDRICHVDNKEIRDTEIIQEKDVNQNTKLIHENISDKEVDETSTHKRESENIKTEPCNIEILEQGPADYSIHKNEVNINNRDLEIMIQKEVDNKLNGQDILENQMVKANSEITENSTQLESSTDKEGESIIIELDQQKSVNLENKIDKEEQNYIKPENKPSELTKPIEKREDEKLEIKEDVIVETEKSIEKLEESTLNVEDQGKDEKLEIKEDSKVETEKSIEKQEESTLNVEDQSKDEKLEIKEDGKVETEKSIEKLEESKLNVEDQSKDEKLEIKEDGKIETEKSIKKQEESTLNVEDQSKNEKLEIKEDGKVETEKSIEKLEESTLNVEDQSKDEKFEIKEDGKVETEKLIEKLEESKLNVEDQTKDEKLEIKEDSKVETEKFIEKQEENKLKLEDQHKDEVIGMEDDSKKGISKSVEKEDESRVKLDQHQDEKPEMKEDSKLVLTTSIIKKQEESKRKLKEQDKDKKLEIKEESNEEEVILIEKQEESKLKVVDQYKDEKLEMKEDSKVETEKSIEKQEESTLNVEDQSKDQKLEIKEDSKVETEKSIEKQEECTLNVEDQTKDEKLEIKEDSKVETEKTIDKLEENKLKLEDQHKDEVIGMEDDSKKGISKSIEKQEESKLKVVDQYKDEKLEMKEDGKVETEKTIEKQEESTLNVEDQIKNEKLEIKDDSKVETEKSIEKQEESTLNVEDQSKDNKLEIKEDGKIETEKSIEKQEESTLNVEVQSKNEKLEMKEDAKVISTTSIIEIQKQSKPNLKVQDKDEKLKIKEQSNEVKVKLVEKQEESKDEKLEMKEDVKVISTTPIENQEEKTLILLDDEPKDELKMKNDNRIETTNSLEKQEECELKLKDQLINGVLEMKDGSKIEITEAIEKQEEIKLKLEEQYKDQKIETKNDSKVETRNTLEKQEESMLTSEDQHKDEVLEMKDDSSVKITETIQKQEESKLTLEDQYKDETAKSIEKQQESSLKLKDQYKDEKLDDTNDDIKVETPKSIEKQEESKLKLEYQRKDEKLEMKDGNIEIVLSIEKQEESQLKLEDEHKTEVLKKQKENKLKSEDLNEDKKLERKEDSKVKLTQSVEKQEEKKLNSDDQDKSEQLEIQEDSQGKIAESIQKQEDSNLKSENQNINEKFETKDVCIIDTSKSIEKQGEIKLKLEDKQRDEKLEIKEDSKGEISKSIKKQEDSNVKSENQNKDEKLETKDDSKIETKSIEVQEKSKLKLEDQHKDENLETKDGKEEIAESITKPEKSKLRLEDKLEDETPDKSIDKLAESELKLEVKKVGKMIEVKEDSVIESDQQKLAQLKDKINKEEESSIIQEKPSELKKSVKQEKESKLKLEDDHKNENLETSLGVKDKNGIKGIGTILEIHKKDSQLEKSIVKEEEESHNNNVETLHEKQIAEKRQSKKSRQRQLGINDEKTNCENNGQLQKFIGEITEKEQVNETAKLENQSKDLAESNTETPKEINKDKKMINKKEIATKQESEKIKEIKSTDVEESILMDEKRILSEKAINQETNLSKDITTYQKDSMISENQNTKKLDVTTEKQIIREKGTLCEEKYSKLSVNEGKIKGTPNAENIMSEINEEEVGSKQKMQSKVSPEFIGCTKPDYNLEFTKPPTYISKTYDVEDTVSQIKTNNKIPTMYKAQTLLYESQLRSSLPPYQRSSEGRTELKDITKAVSESRNTLSEKRTGIARDSRRKPVFSTYLTDRTAVESSRVKLTCSILSVSDPTITWYKNGSVLDNKQKFRSKFVDGLITLEVLNAIPSDSGEYSCSVQNENGSVTSSANLKVYPSFEASPIPPTFTRSIRDTYHLADNELVLECRIRGQPLPAITWLKNNEAIILNERIQSHYLADGVCRLTIISPTSGDSGKYTCKAENSVWSDEISHDVYFAGIESRVCPRFGAIEKIHLNRQAIESRRPHFTNVLTDHQVVSGGTIGLQVEIRGDPTRVEWLREGRSVTELYRHAQTYVDHDIYTLALTDVTEKESGLYTCRAWSSHGNVDMNASITVVQVNLIEGKPATIVSRPAKDLLISVGEDINISFRVRGEPKPKVFILKGIRDITNSLRVCKMTSDDYVKFTLKRSVIGDAGTYCIFARNAYGCDRAFVTVVVRQRASSDTLISDWTYPMDDLAILAENRNYKSVPDRILSEPSVVDGGNNWISLAWSKPDTQAKAPILAYKIECWMLGKEGGARWTELGITPRNSFDAFNLKQGEEYHFRVTPRNRYGWGESVQTSAPIGIGLAGDRPEFTDILTGQLKVLLGESAVLGCSFKGNPRPEIVWMKNGHEIEEEKDRVTIDIDNLNTSLHINEVKIEDEGRYSCEATNIHGRSSTYARMAVITDRHIWEADAKLKRERSAGIDGEYPPQFTMRLRDRRVQATYPVRLTCQVVGNPSPVLTWFKNGKEIPSDGRHITSQDECFHTLEIAPTTLEDGGVYEAMARNCYGAISCRCSLVVDKGIRAYIAPEFCCGLEPLYHLSEGDELRISAVVEAYPSVGVTWYRDGVRLRPSRRAIMTLDRDGQIELALASVTGRDAGVYTCTASNEVGRASTSGKVEVVSESNIVEKTNVPPIVISPDAPYSKEPLFIRKPRSSEAHEGDTVIIECEVIGDPKPDVYWLRDFLKPDYYRDARHFRRVGAGPAYRFEIPHAKFDYTGAYSIIAKNIHGEAKAIISLQILAKDPSAADDAHNIRFGRVEVIPHIDKELTDLLCYDGDAIEFDCRVSGNPEPDIRWFHYNEIVSDCPDFESSYELGIARLKIKQVTAEDEGTYSCEASNSLGKATSSACLVVYPPGEPNTLSQQLRRPPALLSAASTPHSTPRTTPARSKSRTPGPDLRRLRSPTREVAPNFYTYPYNKVAEEGDTIVFQCAVKGLPPPWATWDKDGIIITPSARFNIKEKDETFKILEIEQVTIEDVGLYRITLENDYGRTEASARLEVITQKGKFYGTTRSYSASPRKSLSYRRRTPSFSKQE